MWVWFTDLLIHAQNGQYQSWWEAKLSDKAENLLLQHASLYGINKLQKAAV